MNPNQIVFGMHPVINILKSKLKVSEIWVLKNIQKNKLDLIQSGAEQKRIPIKFIENRKDLEKVAGEDSNHQGVVAFLKSEAGYCELEDLKDCRVVLMLDHITDPRNFGAILRTCDLFGINGIIIPHDRSCELNSIAIKASSGAAFFLKIARVTNLHQTIEKMKQWDFWSYAAVGGEQGEPLGQANWSGKNLIILGSEGDGVSQLLLKSSDFKISIPTTGHVDSLNVSVAAGIILYEASKVLS